LDHEAVAQAETRSGDRADEELVVLLAHADVQPDAVVVEAVDADATLVAVLGAGVHAVVAVGAEVLAGFFRGQVLGVFHRGNHQQAEQHEVRSGVQRCVQLLASAESTQLRSGLRKNSVKR